MSEIINLEKNVNLFLSKASKDYGRIQAEIFSQNMFCELIEGKIKSPIEHIFYIAIHVLAESVFCKLNPEPEFDYQTKEPISGYGIFVTPQYKIDKYYVDFLISNRDDKNSIVIELDGHNFHDKDKNQRAYEKGRDRYLIKSGYKVLHYTGSEVIKDPYKIAHEVLTMMGEIGEDEVYDSSNPFGIN